MRLRREKPPTEKQIAKAVLASNFNNTREVPVTKWCPPDCCDRTGLILTGSPLAWWPPDKNRSREYALLLCPVCKLPTVWRRRR